jgi:two-component system nitrogen regulation sensor histidine kinase GlnL
MSDEILHNPSGIQRTIVDNLNVAVLVLDENLCLIYINPAAENLFHLSSKRTLGSSIDKMLFVDNHLFSRLRDALKLSHPYAEHELTIEIMPGQQITIDYRATPLQAPDQPAMLLLEITHIDRQLRIAREEKLLSEQVASRQLVRGLAHEIKNPLGGLRGAAQLLERELPKPELKEYTRIIIGEADRLQNLVDRMLGPNNMPRMQPTSIHQVTEHVRQLVQAEAADNIFFNLDYDPSLPDIQADPELLIQATLNITRNAVAAMGENGGEITYRTRPVRHFTIGHKHHRLVLQFDIIDNGPGIPEAIREQIFFPMVTGRANGTGLGLSIAQSLINQHGGLIACTSQPGKTVFTIYLPMENRDG